MTIVSILLATLVAYIFSSVYYSPAVMWSMWQKAVWVKMDAKSCPPMMMAKITIISFGLYFIQFFVIAFFMNRVWADTISEAIITSFMFWILIDCSAIVKAMFEQKKMQGVLIWGVDDLLRIIIWSLVLVWMM